MSDAVSEIPITDPLSEIPITDLLSEIPITDPLSEIYITDPERVSPEEYEMFKYYLFREKPSCGCSRSGIKIRCDCDFSFKIRCNRYKKTDKIITAAFDEIYRRFALMDEVNTIEREKFKRNLKYSARSSKDVDGVDEVPLSEDGENPLKKFKLEQEKKLECMEEKYEKTPSAAKYYGCLSIGYRSIVGHFICEKDRKVSEIYPEIGDFFKMKSTDFILFKDLKRISKNDTPDSLSLSILDQLVCIPIDSTEDGVKDEDRILKMAIILETKEDAIEYDVSSMYIDVRKMENMETIMEKLKGELKFPLKDYELEFNGQKLSRSDTAGDLQMRHGSIIYAKVSYQNMVRSIDRDCPGIARIWSIPEYMDFFMDTS